MKSRLPIILCLFLGVLIWASMNTHGSFVQQAQSQQSEHTTVPAGAKAALPIHLAASQDDTAKRLAPKVFRNVSTSGSSPDADDGTIRLTPDKSQVVRLDRDAASVIVSNPANATVLLDTPRVLVVIPRAPGVTSFSVLDAYGDTIMERSVIVTGRSVQKRYVRVRKICGEDRNCIPNEVFYCPEGCYQVTTQIPDPEAEAPDVPEFDGGSPVPPPPPPPNSTEE